MWEIKGIRYLYLIDAVFFSYVAYKKYFTMNFSNVIDVMRFLSFAIPAVGLFLLFIFHKDDKEEVDKNK